MGTCYISELRFKSMEETLDFVGGGVPYPWHMEIPGAGIEPVPQLQPAPQQ